MDHKLDAFIRQVRDAQPLSGTSLIISLYGDAFGHCGGEVWLGSLSALLAPMGFSDRFVRTAVFRLQKEGWLVVEKIGRRSYYRITEHGSQQFRHAESKIYRSEPLHWDGEWDLLLLDNVAKKAQPRLRRALIWLGFGQLSGTLLAAPGNAQGDIPALLSELHVSEQVIYFRARYPFNRSELALKDRVSHCWALSEVAAHYHQFIRAFRPLMTLLREGHVSELTPVRGFQLRLLLIHAWRRVALRDPLLPNALLPAQWEGQIARHLCINLYRRLEQAATHYVSEIAETSIGELPLPDSAYYRRFGGLTQGISPAAQPISSVDNGKV